MSEHDHDKVDDVATQGGWRIEKRVQLPLLLAIVLQTAAFGFWAGVTQTTVDSLQRQVATLSSYEGRLARVETRIDSANETLNRIDTRLERMEDRR